MTVPMLDEMIQLAAAHGAREVVVGMAHRGRLNVLAHNLGRPYETIFAEFEGASTLEAVTTMPAGRHRRRQVPPRRAGLLPAAQRRGDPRQPRVEPVAPRVRPPRRRRRDARRADDAPGPARPPRHRQRGADRAARRRRVPGPGRRRRDAEPAGPRRLQGRRHAAPDPEQPGRLHDRLRGRPLHALGLGPRQGLRLADHPRQRRRRRRLHQRRPARVRLPPGVRPRRRHRPHRLPPLRPQRGRRARVHAARDVRGDQGQEARHRALRRAARRAGRHLARGGRGPAAGDLGRAHAPAPGPQGEDQGRRGGRAPSSSKTGEYQLDRSPSPEVKTAVSADRLRSLNDELLRTPEGFTVHPEARQAARAPARGARRRRRDRLGARRAARVRLAADRGHAGPPDRPGRRARHVLPAPPRPARRQDRPDDLPDPDACPARWRRSSCTTRR